VKEILNDLELFVGSTVDVSGEKGHTIEMGGGIGTISRRIVENVEHLADKKSTQTH